MITGCNASLHMHDLDTVVYTLTVYAFHLSLWRTRVPGNIQQCHDVVGDVSMEIESIIIMAICSTSDKVEFPPIAYSSCKVCLCLVPKFFVGNLSN